ncbi:hypothetical protein MNB_SM-3-8 [hydrothermal vent metagenome]|uniref:Uncharacterized protein n=1 Tax=hydrothermal vent metagenome TaxID=652676 RepID=A0A1W1D449_9ZZZZ
MQKSNLKRGFCTLLFGVSSLYATQSEFVYNNYWSINDNSSKNAIMVGATTATAKGYSAILTNPAGLSSNANIALYSRTSVTTTTAENNEKLTQTKAQNQLAFGALYRSFGIEYKLDDYVALGMGYGYESKYGLFSIGATYLIDTTKRATENATKETSSDEYATGNYSIIGMMWQKSFITPKHFYAIYLGISRKSSGKYSGNSGNQHIIPISPIKMSYGVGFETNIYKTSILLTMDHFTETWKSHNEERIGNAFGAKWFIFDKFSVGGGMSFQTNKNNPLGDINTLGVGVEYSIFNLHLNGSYTQRKTYRQNGDFYLKDEGAHLDVALTF